MISINVKAIFVFLINMGLDFQKRRTDVLFYFIKYVSLKRHPEKSVMEVFDNAQEAVVRETDTD